MSTDNRTIFTDALKTLGTVHNVPEGTRDAIHIAGRSCKAAQILAPGMQVGRYRDGRYGPSRETKMLGIVDPFLDPDSFILENQVFWLMIFPRTITSLRHEWQHPDFPADLTAEQITAEKIVTQKVQAEAEARDHVEKATEAEEWLLGFWPYINCDSYEHMMKIADDFVESGCHLVEGGRWENARSVLSDNEDKFWDSYEIVRGVKLTGDQRGGIFCCSC